MITTSLGVNGADVGPASPQQNNALKGVAAQWGLFSSAGDVSSIVARCAGMLSRWHGASERKGERERASRPPVGPFQVKFPPPHRLKRHRWAHVSPPPPPIATRGSVWALASGGVI